ncbi:FAD-binding oxidoreductase [Acidisoma cellulosilytica]|uniref:FAD-binding oxidoreductase n=1 Tax=Acidisoma cellulosilyticum TaxID=2802395 RepID=A0A963Z726_9PROT|nr:FAD-binding oxidoreductase [Acidisoma cellulosilyticum]MCB8883706.1 FAD-binding oxidoreductase [Acidisoma cellulosilyticum]
MVSVTALAHPDTLYAATCALLPPQPALQGRAESDVCVIGAGFTGLAAAMHLARAGRSVIVLEQGRIASGASGRNGGHASFGMRLKQDKLEAWLGVKDAQGLWRMSLDAMAHLKGLMADGLDCDFVPGVLRLEHRPQDVAAAHRYAERMRRDYGFDALEPLTASEVRQRVATTAYHGGIYDRASGHLHPLKLAMGLARRALDAGAVIHEQTRVQGVAAAGERLIVRTDRGQILARDVIYAGNGMMSGLDRDIDRHIMPIRNYILATEPLPPEVAAGLIAEGAAVSDSRFVVYYFRVSADRRLIFGGGETYSYRTPADLKGFVRRHMLGVYPQLADLRIDYAWGGTLGITRSRMPYLRQPAPGRWLAGGYSGKGVVLAPYIGKVLADAIGGDRRAFDLLARLPSRRFPGGATLRAPLLAAGMAYYKFRDGLG